MRIGKKIKTAVSNPSEITGHLRMQLGKPVIKTRECLLRKKLSNKDAKIAINRSWLKIRIHKSQGAKFIVKGKLTFFSELEGNSPIFIDLRKNATLQIDGDLIIDNGVTIVVDENAILKIGGRHSESGSSIGSNSKIEVYKSVEIGKDFQCAWNVYITDCDWHPIEYNDVASPMQADVAIGDHAWISHDCSILKGTKIGNNCIVGCKSLLTDNAYPPNSLIAGIPAKVIRGGCNWKRERS